ncbi:MAG: NAD(P)/FAD-dependent oxidoreductase, partial [Candidatus Aminicenantes bacterium]|nr:NAD(P)/FAD-dependent oxidoreductase [Candidatus Aminicenantes bacterium]
MPIVEVAVVGAGPAGASAAVQLRRSGVDFRIFEKAGTGGLLRNAYLVENYPGFPRGISGPALVRLIERHLKRLGIDVEKNEVLRIGYRNGRFILKTRRGDVRSRVCVIAAGTEPRRLPDGLVPPEAEGRVFYEAATLADRSKGMRIAVLGSGDAAFDYALNFARRNDVFILHRGRKPKGLPLLRRRARNRPRIVILDGARLEAVK